MAKDDKRRKSFWDDEDEDTGFIPATKPSGKPGTGGQTGAPGAIPRSEAHDIDQLIHDARTLMEQTHQLYLMYLSGIEKRPPIEKLKFLESRVAEIQRVGGNVTASKFKISQFVSLYNTTRELWERKLREREKV